MRFVACKRVRYGAGVSYSPDKSLHIGWRVSGVHAVPGTARYCSPSRFPACWPPWSWVMGVTSLPPSPPACCWDSRRAATSSGIGRCHGRPGSMHCRAAPTRWEYRPPSRAEASCYHHWSGEACDALGGEARCQWQGLCPPLRRRPAVPRSTAPRREPPAQALRHFG